VPARLLLLRSHPQPLATSPDCGGLHLDRRGELDVAEFVCIASEKVLDTFLDGFQVSALVRTTGIPTTHQGDLASTIVHESTSWES
jgi:hypothetical protein